MIWQKIIYAQDNYTRVMDLSEFLGRRTCQHKAECTGIKVANLFFKTIMFNIFKLRHSFFT